MSGHSAYAGFPTLETISLTELSEIRATADKMIRSYEQHESLGDFSFRILLPRGEKVGSKAKRLGFSLQGEFILGLRKRNLVPKVKEVRYLHDEGHYGWILGSPEVFQRFEGGV